MSDAIIAREPITPSHGVGKILTPWKPGQSGNPSGRPRGMRELREACRKLCPEGVEAVGRIVTETVIDESGNVHNAHEGKVVVAAVQILFTWAYGKPPDYDPREDRPGVAIDTSVMTTPEQAMLLKILRKGLLKEMMEQEAGPA